MKHGALKTTLITSGRACQISKSLAKQPIYFGTTDRMNFIALIFALFITFKLD